MADFTNNLLDTSGIMLGILLPFIVFFIISEIQFCIVKIAELKEERKIRDILSSSWYIKEIKQPPNPEMTTLILRDGKDKHFIKFSAYKEEFLKLSKKELNND